jgi:hypothetical protein
MQTLSFSYYYPATKGYSGGNFVENKTHSDFMVRVSMDFEDVIFELIDSVSYEFILPSGTNMDRLDRIIYVYG